MLNSNICQLTRTSPLSLAALQGCRRDLGGRQRESGVVLLLVLWVIVAMGLLGMSFSVAIRTEVNAARNVVDQKQAYYLARAGIENTVFKILESRSAFARTQQAQQQGLDELPEVLTGASTLHLQNGMADVQIIDETGKINLNLVARSGSDHLIFNLLIMVGVDATDAGIITDSIVDWVDEDDLYHPNGAEDDYYLSRNPAYRAKNGLFDVPDELLLVRGITPEIYYGKKGVTEAGQRVEYYGLQNFFTTFSRSGLINVNSAPLPVLAAIDIIDYDTAARIYSLGQQAPIRDMTELMEAIPGLPTDITRYLTTRPSFVYTLVSTGHLEGSSVISVIRCVVQVDGLGPKGYSILYWNEANTEI